MHSCSKIGTICSTLLLFASSVSTFSHQNGMYYLLKNIKKNIIMTSGTIDEYEFSMEIDIPEEILTQHDIN